MITYQYQIIRYTHDQLSGEFVNVGVLIYEPSTSFLDCRVVTKFSRISNFFGEVNGTYLLSSLKHFELKIKQMAETRSFQQIEGLSFQDLSSISNYLLPKDDSALGITSVKVGVDVDIQIAFHDLFERLVERYIPHSEGEVQTDQRAWRKVYKQYFDSVGVTEKLTKHEVTTSKDKIQFEQAWKNGVWNCFQTLSFDLKQLETIKNKVYKWSGILNELETSAEPLKIYLLTTTPKLPISDLQSFIEQTLEEHSTNNIQVSVITEDEAAQFAATVRNEMRNHNVL